MLKFEEQERPSFVELAKLVLTSTENSIDSPKNGAQGGPMGKRMSGAKGLGQGAAAAAAQNKSIELQNRKVSKTFSQQNFAERDGDADPVEGAAQVSATDASMEKGQVGRRIVDSSKSDLISHPPEDSQQNLMTQSELFKQYSEQNHLMLNLTNNMFWFEFGGNKIGRLYIEGPEQEEFPKWRLIAKYRGEFPCHFTTLYINGGGQG